MSVQAQAVVGESNSLSAQFAYTFAPSGKIVSSSSGDDSPFDDAVPSVPVFVHTFHLGAQYTTPIRGLAIEAGLPLVGVELGEDSFMHYPVRGEYDDGDLHWTPTDLRVGLRYQIMAIEQHMGLAFHLATSIPVADYPTQGFAAPGQHLMALHLGASIARTLEPAVPNLYFQVGYEFSKRERVDVDDATEEFSRDYSDAELEIGYFLPAGFTLAAIANLRLHHGGVEYARLIHYSRSVIEHHDELADEDVLMAGGDLGYDVTEDFSAVLHTRFFLWGNNTRNQNLFGLSAQYRFF